MPDTIPPPPGEDTSEIDVSFEKWALTAAKLLRRTIIERAEVLRESGFSGSWKDVDEHWYEALIQDLDSGKLERLDRYMRICGDEMQERLDNDEEPKSPLDAIGGPSSHVPGSATLESTEDDEPTSEALDLRGVLPSVTPPLGTESSASIEVDLTEIDDGDEDGDDEDNEEISPDDTRVSAAIPAEPSDSDESD